MRAIQVRSFGGPGVLELTEVADPTPDSGQLLVEVARAGVNYMDVIQRVGRELDHPHGAHPPFIMGVEGSGHIVQCGPAVHGFKVGDRVAWAFSQGSYADRVVVNAEQAVLVPEAVSDELAASLMQQGITAHFLATSCHPISPGEYALVHAGAGGVGLLLTQIIKARGGFVISTVSSPEKKQMSLSVGADEVVRYDEADVAEAVRKITDGRGVAVVYDGVGQATFEASLASLSPRGCLVYFGASSGPVRPLDPDRLMNSGSLFLTRPSMADYTQTRAELERRANQVFAWAMEGSLRVHIGGRFPLADASAAHQLFDRREHIGKLLLEVR
jgi:NADPH:quinone reductase